MDWVGAVSYTHLNYFGEAAPEKCGNCSCCLFAEQNAQEVEQRAAAAKQRLSLIHISVSGRCHQLCGSPQYAGQPRGGHERAAVHLRPVSYTHLDVYKRQVLAVMPTGAGKSICYQVPALLLPGITIVVSPLSLIHI